VSWLAASYKIQQELHVKQSEAGYEALVNANTLAWRSDALAEEARREKSEALAVEARKLRRQSEDSMVVARLKIAAFGDERVVRALSDYFSKHTHAAMPCADKEKFRSDTQIYKAIRNTLGVGGGVSDEQLATVIFVCNLK